MEIDDQTMTNSATANNAEAIGGPVYEPLTHSETYLMSTMSDMSEDNLIPFETFASRKKQQLLTDDEKYNDKICRFF